MEIRDSFSLKNGAQNAWWFYSLSVQHLPNHFLSHYVQILLILHQYSSMHHKRFVLLLKRNHDLITFLYCHKFMPCNRSFPFLYTFKALTNLSRFSSVAFHIWNNTVSEMPFAWKDCVKISLSSISSLFALRNLLLDLIQ